MRTVVQRLLFVAGGVLVGDEIYTIAGIHAWWLWVGFLCTTLGLLLMLRGED